MEKPVQNYWLARLNKLKAVLEENNFEVFLAESGAQARTLVLDRVLPSLGAKSVSWAGSLTFTSIGLYESIKAISGLEMIDTFDKKVSRDEVLERRRKALLADLFITGTNAVTETGKLVNLDMYGNRVAGITFGPRHVVILVGRNKVVPDIEAATSRIKEYAAPVNAMRLEKKTPCAQSSYCEECRSPDRICNTWTVTEKSFPEKRIKVVLINEDLGF